jgi:hypothetical protein
MVYILTPALENIVYEINFKFSCLFRYEMALEGIDPYTEFRMVNYTGTHEQSVYKTLDGWCDIATCRTGCA